MERGASEHDIRGLPLNEDNILDWRYFNTCMYTLDLKWDSVEKEANSNKTKRIDLRHYMIESPYKCFTTDKLQRILDVFRFMQLR